MCDMNDIGNAAIGGAVGLPPGVSNVVFDKVGFDPMANIFGVHDSVDEQASDLPQADYLRRQRQNFDNFAGQYTDPGRYAAREAEYSANNNARTANRFAAMGLAGSSAYTGAANEGDRQLHMQMMDRQLRDRAMIEQTRNSFTGQLNQMDMAKLNQQISAANRNQAMWGSILGAAGTVGGGLLGGPPGAMAGGAIGGSMGGSQQSYIPQDNMFATGSYNSSLGTVGYGNSYSQPEFGSSYQSSPSSYNLGGNYQF